MKINVTGKGFIPVIKALAPVYNREASKDLVMKLLGFRNFRIYKSDGAVLITKANIDAVFNSNVNVAVRTKVDVPSTMAVHTTAKPVVIEKSVEEPVKEEVKEETLVEVVEATETVDEVTETVDEVVDENVDETEETVVEETTEDEVVDEVEETTEETVEEEKVVENNDSKPQPHYNKKKKKHYN